MDNRLRLDEENVLNFTVSCDLIGVYDEGDTIPFLISCQHLRINDVKFQLDQVQVLQPALHNLLIHKLSQQPKS